jgi:hypothetical protein
LHITVGFEGRGRNYTLTPDAKVSDSIEVDGRVDTPFIDSDCELVSNSTSPTPNPTEETSTYDPPSTTETSTTAETITPTATTSPTPDPTTTAETETATVTGTPPEVVNECDDYPFVVTDVTVDPAATAIQGNGYVGADGSLSAAGQESLAVGKRLYSEDDVETVLTRQRIEEVANRQ